VRDDIVRDEMNSNVMIEMCRKVDIYRIAVEGKKFPGSAAVKEKLISIESIESQSVSLSGEITTMSLFSIVCWRAY